MTLLALAILLFVTHTNAANDRGPFDGESLRGYMAGEYELIGRKPDSTATYTGHVTFRDDNGVLQVARGIAGKTDKYVARFNTVAGPDRVPVLKMRFHFDGRDYDSRFTGYVYLAGTKSPGIESLFPIRK